MPSFTFRAGNSLPLGLSGSLYLSYTRRTYGDPYAVSLDPEGGFVTEDRNDASRQAGLSLSWPVARQVGVFGDASYTNQTSSLPDYEFDQVRLLMGLSVDLWSTGGVRQPIELTPLAPSADTPLVTPSGVSFRFSSFGATSVMLVGDFNGWNARSHPMDAAGKGGWETTIPLDRGIWRYAFVVDGEWIRPPGAPRYEEDGFGGTNGVVEVLDVSSGAVVTQGPESRPKTQEPSPSSSPDRDPDSR